MTTRFGNTGRPVVEAEMACIYQGRLCPVWFHLKNRSDACITHNGKVKFIRGRDIEYVFTI